jgi:Ca2+-dependent lipid-binding protein
MDGELSAAERAEMKAGECRRRPLELSSGDPITAADVELAAQHAAEAEVYADQAKKESSKVALWVAELRKRSRTWLPQAGHQTSN